MWHKSKAAWLMEKNAISHSVDMAKGCHSACSLVTSLCHFHLMGYYVFIRQPRGLAIFLMKNQLSCRAHPHYQMSVYNSCALRFFFICMISQYNTVQHNTMQYNTTQYNELYWCLIYLQTSVRHVNKALHSNRATQNSP